MIFLGKKNLVKMKCIMELLSATMRLMTKVLLKIGGELESTGRFDWLVSMSGYGCFPRVNNN